jgi:hypothetical protein
LLTREQPRFNGCFAEISRASKHGPRRPNAQGLPPNNSADTFFQRTGKLRSCEKLLLEKGRWLFGWHGNLRRAARNAQHFGNGEIFQAMSCRDNKTWCHFTSSRTYAGHARPGPLAGRLKRYQIGLFHDL